MAWLEVTRDIIVIVVALISLAANVLLIILGWRMWTLMKALKAEVDPIVASVQRTSDTIRGTTTVVGDALVGPVAKLAAMNAAGQTLTRHLTTVVRGGRRR